MRTQPVRCAAILAVVGLAHSAHAQVTTYSAPVTGNWSNGALWSGGVPDAATEEAHVTATGAAYVLTLDINAAIARLTLDSVDATLTANGRTLTVGTLAEFLTGTASFSNSNIAGAGNLLNLATFNMVGTVGVSTANFSQEGIANVIGTGGFHAVLNRTGSMSNVGTLDLTSIAATNSTLQVSGTFTNGAAGILNASVGAGGGRFVTVADFQNNGTVNINQSTTFNAGGSLFNNAATFNTAPGVTASVTGGGLLTFRQSAGTLSNLGALELGGERFEFAGGTITGNDVQITSGQLDITGTGAGGFDLIATNAFTGAIAAGQHVDVVGTGGFHSVLNAAAGMTNAGAINLTSIAATNATLQGTTVGNTGAINSQAAAGGGRFVSLTTLTSSGSININANTTFDGGSGVLTNTGAFNTAVGRTATFSGGGLMLFTHAGGVINNLGGIALNGERFEYTGGTILGNDIQITNGQLHIFDAGTGAGGFDAMGANAFTGGVGAAQHLDILANASFHAVLTGAPGMTNAGVINLTSNAATNSTLANPGTVSNFGTLNAEPGSGGARTVSVFSLQSLGTININANTTFDGINSVLVNTGTFNTAPGTTATFGGSGVLTFNQAGGTLNNLGGIALNAERFEFTGGAMGGNDVAITNGQLHITGAGAGGFDVIGTNAFTGTIAPAQHVDALANSSFHTVMTASLGMSNDGVLNLTSSAATNVTIASPATVNNGGTINSELASGGDRTIGVNLLNNPGAININANTLFNGSAGRLNNSGSFNTSAGRTATFSGPGLLTFASGGTIDNQGTIHVNGERFEFVGGSITGNDVQITNGQLHMGGPGAAGFDMIGNGTISGAIHAGQHVDMLATGSFHTVTSVVDGLSNAGTISLTSSAATNSQLVSVPQLTNTGLVQSLPGSGGARTLTLNNFVNQGAFDVHVNTLMDANGGAIQNHGTISTDAGVTLTITGPGVMLVNHNAGTISNNGAMLLNGERFNFNGGTTTGNDIVIRSGELNITGTTSGAFDLVASTTLTGNIAPGQRVDVLSTGADHTNVSASSFTNGGTLNLTSSAATNSQIIVDSTLTNAPTGVINIQPGAGGSRTLAGNLTNQGELNVQYNGAISRTGLTVINSGTMVIAAGATLRLEGSGTVSVLNNITGRVTGSGTLDLTQVDSFLNVGAFAPGIAAADITGDLTVTGAWSQADAGDFEVQLAAATLAQFDRLLISGPASLNGTLAVSLVGGFIPAPSDTFVILDAASLSGVFANAATTVSVITGGTFDVIYNTGAGTVTLTNYVIPAPGTTGLLAMMGLLAARRRR